MKRIAECANLILFHQATRCHLGRISQYDGNNTGRTTVAVDVSTRRVEDCWKHQGSITNSSFSLLLCHRLSHPIQKWEVAQLPLKSRVPKRCVIERL